MDPDDRLRWLLETRLLHDVYSRHEAFLLLDTSFAEASPEVKQEIWADGMDAYHELLADDGAREPTFAVWIHRVDPQFRPAQEVVEGFAADHPEWQASEHPEFLRYTGGARAIPPRRLPEELDAHPTFERLREIETTDRSSFAESTLQDAVAASVRINPEAGVEILEGIAAAAAWDTALWDGVRYGLERASIPEDLWPRLLAATTRHEDAHRGLETLSRVLLAAVNSDPPQIDSPHFVLAGEAIQNQLARLRESHLDVAEPGDDIMFTALNSWPGEVSEYLIATAARLEALGSDPCSAPGLSDFLVAVKEATPANWALVALVVLARDFPYLQERCPDLVEGTVLRAFDWSEPVVAAVAWEGIAYARWSRQTVDVLRPTLPDLVSHLMKLTDNARRGLMGTLAAVTASYDMEATAPPDWLDALIARNDDATRADFAHALRWRLEAMEPAERQDLWTRWLRDWWERRRAGFPAQVGPQEGSMMLAWTLPLIGVLHEVVPLALDLQLAPRTWDFLYAVRDSELPTTNPTDTVMIVAHVLGQRQQLYDREVVFDILETAVAAGASEEGLLAVCNAIAALGVEPPAFCPPL
ncbi:MAG: DUF4020 domain-containing protein [Dehalococcoidia bacterium]